GGEGGCGCVGPRGVLGGVAVLHRAEGRLDVVENCAIIIAANAPRTRFHAFSRSNQPRAAGPRRGPGRWRPHSNTDTLPLVGRGRRTTNEQVSRPWRRTREVGDGFGR